MTLHNLPGQRQRTSKEEASSKKAKAKISVSNNSPNSHKHHANHARSRACDVGITRGALESYVTKYLRQTNHSRDTEKKQPLQCSCRILSDAIRLNIKDHDQKSITSLQGNFSLYKPPLRFQKGL